MLRRVIASAAVALLSTAALAAVAPHGASAHGIEAAKARQCNVHTFNTKVTDVKGRTDVTLTRLAGVVYPGRTKITKSDYVSSEQNRVAHTSLHARGEAEVGGTAVLKKLVSVFAEVSGEIEYYTRETSTRGETRRIYSHVETTIPKASTVAWFKGYQTARGTGTVKYCDAVEGKGNGFVKTYTAVWKTYATFDVEGAQRCDLTSPNAVAAAAKRAVCTS